MQHQHEKLNYVEFGSGNLQASKRFFETAFNWKFTDYGSGYTAFNFQGLEGGFFSLNDKPTNQEGAPLLVFYSDSLEDTMNKVRQAGANIVKEIFEFPGGRRFHFQEPGGNELAVWSDS